jgi:hypothetical protein
LNWKKTSLGKNLIYVRSDLSMYPPERTNDFYWLAIVVDFLKSQIKESSWCSFISRQGCKMVKFQTENPNLRKF